MELAAADGDPGSGRDLPDILEERSRACRVLEGQELIDPERIDDAGRAAGREDALDLGGEPEAAAMEAVVERLDAEAIARQQQTLQRTVPERDGEHAVQAREERQAVLFVEPRDHLAVARAAEAVPLGCQLVAQLAVVVDLPVENDLHRAGLVADGLIARDQIQHREPPHSQADPGLGVYALPVRPAMAHHLAHGADQLARRRTSAGGDSGDAAHGQPFRRAAACAAACRSGCARSAAAAPGWRSARAARRAASVPAAGSR